MTGIPFVCFGNICRGPIAGFIMRDLVKKAGPETQLLIEYAGHPGDVAVPWYTGGFEAAWRDAPEGCQGIARNF